MALPLNNKFAMKIPKFNKTKQIYEFIRNARLSPCWFQLDRECAVRLEILLFLRDSLAAALLLFFCFLTS